MRLCKLTFTIISSLPCLHIFWHAIPTSFYIFNVFLNIHNTFCDLRDLYGLTADLLASQPTVLELFLRYSVEISKCTNASELISWHKTQQESIWVAYILWPTLVHVHIATEVDLETLHPGATCLRFMIKIWLVTLTGLTNSLSTSNFSEVVLSLVFSLWQGAKDAQLDCQQV